MTTKKQEKLKKKLYSIQKPIEFPKFKICKYKDVCPFSFKCQGINPNRSYNFKCDFQRMKEISKIHY